MREMEVVGVRVEMPLNAPVLVLREKVLGGRHVPIWIGATEAPAIVAALEGVEATRPLTHELMGNALTALGHRIMEVRITELDEATFHAVLVVDDREIDARPSDAVALAIRAGARILCDDAVVEEAGVVIPADADAELEAFREFLDQIDADDFRAGS